MFRWHGLWVACGLWLAGCPGGGGDGATGSDDAQTGEGEDAAGETTDSRGAGVELGVPDTAPPPSDAGPADADRPADAADASSTDAVAQTDRPVPPTDAEAPVDAGAADATPPPADVPGEPPCVPVPEVCDGRDNDCDGKTDVSADGTPLVTPCYDGEPGTEGVGVCRGGSHTCDPALPGSGACEGQVLPAFEICDAVDNDCNGRIDDLPDQNGMPRSCACAPGEAQACYAGPEGTEGVGPCRAGRQTCLPDGSTFGACEGAVLPGQELCNGQDDDCDGRLDADVIDAGGACPAGVGACLRMGTVVCDPASARLVCDAVPGAPAARETCNGEDDDCDGETDEGLGLDTPCTLGQGRCVADGVLACDANGELICNARPGAPAEETCNGEDDDCDGEPDEDFPLGDACVVGEGACRVDGVIVCAADGRTRCDAVEGGARAEVCDGLDNDCDGVVDDNPTDAGQPCSAGVGACARQAETVCNGGRVSCPARPGAPSAEVCDEADNDCDGDTDEDLDCTEYLSCLDAYVRGRHASGQQVVRPEPRGPSHLVYCDQTTDNGGWTLVGSTAGETFDDRGSDWYPDLLTLAPAGANAGLWGGLAALGGTRFDLRFACRRAPAAADAPMTVDLSFYRVPWYHEIAAAADDAASCFQEADGAGQDLPPPARRNNLTGALAFRGNQWDVGHAEGEDVCDDTNDFTVDFDDRGMDNNQADGTDWGEDDGSRKCGVDGLDDGQWFVFARERRRIAVVGPSPLVAPLQAAGLPAEALDYDASLPGRLTNETYEALLIGRYVFNWPAITRVLRDTLNTFSLGGGSVFTEYDGASLFGHGYAQSYAYSQGAAAPLFWFRYFMAGGGSLEADTPVTQADLDAVAAGGQFDEVFQRVPNPLRGGGGTEFFTWIQPREPVEDTYLRVLATFNGNGTALFPRGALTAVASGRRCGGAHYYATFDYQDEPDDPELRTFVQNLGRFALEPPTALLQDTCPNPGFRQGLMLCGASGRQPQAFLRGGYFLNVVNGCAPDNNIQAMLVTRNGAAQLDARVLQAYLDQGGIVITEYNVSDEVYNLAFGTQQPQGARFGDCQDNVQPAVQFRPLDTFWDENRFEPVAAGRTGCGFDLAAFPGITPLGGPGGAVVSLAYRDRGNGRLWLVEADWQDLEDSFTPQSAGLMHYMISHGRGVVFDIIF